MKLDGQARLSLLPSTTKQPQSWCNRQIFLAASKILPTCRMRRMLGAQCLSRRLRKPFHLASSSRPELAAPTSLLLKDNHSACLSPSAARMLDCLRPGKNMRGKFRADSWERLTTNKGDVALCSLSPRASNTFAARKPLPTFARTKDCSPWPPLYILKQWVDEEFRK